MRETFGLINEEDWNNNEYAQEKAMLKKQAMRNQRFSHDYNATSLRVNGPHPKYQRDATEQQKLQRGKNLQQKKNASENHFTVKMTLFLASQQQAFSLYIHFPKKITVVEAISYTVDEFNNKVTSNRLKNKPELYQITKASPINGGPERT